MALTDPAQFFLAPERTRHRQYEALRAYFVEHRPSAEVARAFGYTPASFRVLCHHFRHDPERTFFVDPPHGPQEQPKKDRARRLIIEMRKRNLSVYDIADALGAQHIELSPTAVAEVLLEEGFARLPRRRDDERPATVRPEAADRADVRRFQLAPTTFETHVGGLFVLLPLLVKLGIDQLCARDFGHEEPTVLLTNDESSAAGTLLERYARRMLIENGLEDQVHFFHVDALSSAVAMKVDFDVVLTVIATGLYRVLGKHLHGFDHAKARQIFRRFLDTNAKVDVSPDRVRVRLPRRAHNPLLFDSGLLAKPIAVPWWGGAALEVEIP